MSHDYLTTIYTSDEFIEKLIDNNLGISSGSMARLEENEFTVLTNYNGIIKQLLELSKSFLDEVFTAITRSEYVWETKTTRTYEVSNGEVLCAREDIWFDIEIDTRYLSHIDPEIIDAFEKEVSNYFNAVDMELVNSHKFDSFWGLYQKHCSDLFHEYRADNILFKSRRKDVYTVSVDVTVYGDQNDKSDRTQAFPEDKDEFSIARSR